MSPSREACPGHRVEPSTPSSQANISHSLPGSPQPVSTYHDSIDLTLFSFVHPLGCRLQGSRNFVWVFTLRPQAPSITLDTE